MSQCTVDGWNVSVYSTVDRWSVSVLTGGMSHCTVDSLNVPF